MADEEKELATNNPNNNQDIEDNPTIKCNGCMENFKSNTILKHLSKKEECKSKYSQAGIELLKSLSKARKSQKEKLYQSENKEKLTEKPNDLLLVKSLCMSGLRWHLISTFGCFSM